MRLSLLCACQVIRLFEEENLVVEPNAQQFYTCCNVVSRPKAQSKEPSPCTDEELQKSLDRLKETLPEDFEWPHREGLAQVLHRVPTAWLTNVKVDVTTHLVDRMGRWFVVRLAADIDQPGITEEDLWTIARRVVATLTWNEDRAIAQALSAGKPVPAPPPHVKPDGIDKLLGAAALEKLPALNQETKDCIWKLFDGTLMAHIKGALPLCPSNFGKAAYDKR